MPRYLITIELNGYFRFLLVTKRSFLFDSYNMARAAPFRRLFAGDFLGHFEPQFHDRPERHGELCGKLRAAHGKIARNAFLGRKRRLPQSHGQRNTKRVAWRRATVAAGWAFHNCLLTTKDVQAAQNCGRVLRKGDRNNARNLRTLSSRFNIINSQSLAPIRSWCRPRTNLVLYGLVRARGFAI